MAVKKAAYPARESIGQGKGAWSPAAQSKLSVGQPGRVGRDRGTCSFPGAEEKPVGQAR